VISCGEKRTVEELVELSLSGAKPRWPEWGGDRRVRWRSWIERESYNRRTLQRGTQQIEKEIPLVFRTFLFWTYWKLRSSKFNSKCTFVILYSLFIFSTFDFILVLMYYYILFSNFYIYELWDFWKVGKSGWWVDSIIKTLTFMSTNKRKTILFKK